eukprot:CAMPEP_0176368688 /NCGR_PEP_ID=MMETSP0126-20121128/22778_1 /TAXON_ID=141414 ORGANISM="Strombidinopsis acuminatum, Strain SPMC142" /NCGR_SAMPLE_ID=MMETSP0126 /ASSEMBLY_ACC=CAM_ASM_000229 /LENGTH=69 /DNA_ID=CAMNT_0017727055 /DNA_START=979 /DNA_END=1188 /DNA_ORIENTATION=+
MTTNTTKSYTPVVEFDLSMNDPCYATNEVNATGRSYARVEKAKSRYARGCKTCLESQENDDVCNDIRSW